MFFRRTDNGPWHKCHAKTITGAKREAAVIYRFGRDDAVWEISTNDGGIIVSRRIRKTGKWMDLQ